MAFDKEPLKITPNGINLIPPVDQVAPGDALELTGWFAGSAGGLQQARGWVQKNAAGVTPGPLDTIGECNGRVYYAGAGSLYQVGRDTAGVPIYTGFDGAPLGLCALQNLMWVMNRGTGGTGFQLKDDGDTGTLETGTPAVGVTTPWGATAPPSPTYVQGTSGALVDGVHAYFATYVDNYGYETNPCGEIDITVSNGGADDGSIVFTIEPIGHVTPLKYGWNLYHQSPSAAGPYQVNGGVPIPYGTNTYTDFGDLNGNALSTYGYNQDDPTLIANDIVLEDDHDPAPACMVMAAIPYNGRLVVANSAQYPCRIWFTEPDQPSFFPGSGNPQAGNWFDIQAQSGDQILHISVKVGYCVIYLSNSIWQVVGDLGSLTSTISVLIPGMGVAGIRSVVGTSQGDLAVVRQGINYGIYRVTEWEQRIGAKIEPIFRGLATECYSAMNAAASGTIAVGYSLGRMWVSYPDGANTAPSRTLIYDVEQDSVSFSVNGRWFSRAGGFGAYYHGSLFWLGATGATIVSLDDGTGDENGGHVALAYQSGYMDSGDPDNEKTYGDLVISHNTGGENLNIDIRRNKNADAFTLGSITSSAMTRQVIPMLYPSTYTTVALRGLPIEAFNIAVRIYGNGPIGLAAGAPGVLIDGPIILHHFLKPPRAMTWDSGPTDHKMQGVKEVDRLEVDLDAPTQVTLTIWTDFFTPGALAVAYTTLLPATVGRQIIPVVLTTNLQGRIWRYQLQAIAGTPAPFLAYKVHVRAVQIGVWVDGSVGDIWYTRALEGGGE